MMMFLVVSLLTALATGLITSLLHFYLVDPEQPVFYLALTDLFVSFGFALLLVGLYILSGRRITVYHGILWGIAGFATFSVAPAFVLVSDLELLLRQGMWLGAVLLMGCGIALLVFARQHLLGLAAIGTLLLFSHVPEEPDDLVSGFVFWICLGTISGFLYEWMGKRSKADT